MTVPEVCCNRCICWLNSVARPKRASVSICPASILTPVTCIPTKIPSGDRPGRCLLAYPPFCRTLKREVRRIKMLTWDGSYHVISSWYFGTTTIWSYRLIGKLKGPPFKNMPLTSCRWDVRKALVSTYLFIHLCLAKMKILGENCNIFGNNAILRYYDLIMFSATFFAEKGYFFPSVAF